jgi:hypothetical protein
MERASIVRRAAGIGLSCIVALSRAALAQGAAPDSNAAPTPAYHGVEIWTGRATHSSRWGFLGDTPNVNLALLAVRWTTPIRASSRSVLEYTVDVVPVAVLSPPLSTGPGAESASGHCEGDECALYPLARTFPPGSAFGVGVSPLGLTWVFLPARRIRPVLATTGGLIWFDRRVPTTGAARINFAGTAEAGFRAALNERADLTAAYRFHHISNAGLARENSALASHVFSLGVRVRRGR